MVKLLKYIPLAILLSCVSTKQTQKTQLNFKEIPNMVVDNSSPFTHIVKKSLEEGIREIRPFVSESPYEDAYAFYNNTWEDIGSSEKIRIIKNEKEGYYFLETSVETTIKRLEEIFKKNKNVKLIHYHPSYKTLENYLISIGESEKVNLSVPEQTVLPSIPDIASFLFYSKKHHKLKSKGTFQYGIVTEYGTTYLTLTEKGKETNFDKLSKKEFMKIAGSYIAARTSLAISKTMYFGPIDIFVDMLGNDYYTAKLVSFEK